VAGVVVREVAGAPPAASRYDGVPSPPIAAGRLPVPGRHALAGLVTALVSAVPASTVVGVGAGLLLLGYAVLALVRVARRG
jgi:hypothetical protein